MLALAICIGIGALIGAIVSRPGTKKVGAIIGGGEGFLAWAAYHILIPALFGLAVVSAVCYGVWHAFFREPKRS